MRLGITGSTRQRLQAGNPDTNRLMRHTKAFCRRQRHANAGKRAGATACRDMGDGVKSFTCFMQRFDCQGNNTDSMTMCGQMLACRQQMTITHQRNRKLTGACL